MINHSTRFRPKAKKRTLSTSRKLISFESESSQSLNTIQNLLYNTVILDLIFLSNFKNCKKSHTKICTNFLPGTYLKPNTWNLGIVAKNSSFK